MKRGLLRLCMVLSMSIITSALWAQAAPKLLVFGNSAIEGSKIFTFSADANPAWGRALDSIWIHVPLVKAVDSLACSPVTNGPYTDKFVLIYRGSCEFGAKALEAQNNGAIGVIIVNNVAGAPVGMGPGAVGAQVVIPVLMISQSDGNAINDAINNGVSVDISLTGFGFGYNDDIGFIENEQSVSQAAVMPLHQLVSSNGDPAKYQLLNAAIVGNFGINTPTNVELREAITWTPRGGSPSVVHRDTAFVSSFTDTFTLMFSNDGYQPHPTGLGTYNTDYELVSAAIDENPADNEISTSMMVSDSIFSKGNYNFATGAPVSTIGYRFASTAIPEFIWGPLYTIAVDSYAARKAQYVISLDGVELFTPSSSTEVFLLGWTDVNADGIMQSGEAQLEGVGSYSYGSNDSSGKPYTVDLLTVSNSTVVLESGKDYWLVVGTATGQFLGCDGGKNYFPRSLAQINRTPSVQEWYNPIFGGIIGDFLSVSTEATMFGFAHPYDIDSVGFLGQRGLVPAVPLIMSQNKVTSTSIEHIPSNFASSAVYPNPATDRINVEIKLKKQADVVHY